MPFESHFLFRSRARLLEISPYVAQVTHSSARSGPLATHNTKHLDETLILAARINSNMYPADWAEV